MAKNSHTIPDSDPASATTPSFEAALAELEGIVAAMEAGKMPLQEALDAYKRGVALLTKCRATLTAAEQQIRILDADGLREFEAPPGSPAGSTDPGGDQDA
jgi:exodeoxyribonuclease VII small subunit